LAPTSLPSVYQNRGTAQNDRQIQPVPVNSDWHRAPLLKRPRLDGLVAGGLLVALSAIAPLSVDMFLPSLPTIADELASADATVQLGVTLFLVAFAVSQLVYGPASDRFGRRPMLVAGLGLFVAGGALCLVADSVEVLLAGRVLQGLGGGAGPALAQAIVLDVYGRERAGRILAYMAIALPLAPTLAPIAGGILHDLVGWRSVFVTLTGLGVLLLAGYLAILPETNRRRGAGSGGLASLAADYRTILSSRTYVGYVLVIALMFSGQLVFISSSSFVLQDELGLAAGVYGFSFGFVAVGLMFGASISSRLAMSLPGQRIVLIGAVTSSASATMMAGLAWGGLASVPSVLLPMFFTAVGFGITRPAATAGALVPFPQIAGLASAMMGFTQLTTASTFNIAYGATAGVSSRALATGVFVTVVTALVAVGILRPGEKTPPAPRVAGDTTIEG